MKSRLILILPSLLLGGCDNMFALDNYVEPNAMLTGEVVYQGQKVGVRSNGVQLELWQPGSEFQLNTKIPVHIDQDGSFSAAVFDGNYEINLLGGNGPWLDNPTRIPVVVRGNTMIQVPVTPFYTINNINITYNAGLNAPGGVIQASVDLGQINTSRAVEFVGLYVGTTAIVDRTNSVVRQERTRAQIPNLSAPITFSLNLPPNIHVTPSPERRDQVSVRIGVKTVGVAEMIFSQVIQVGI
jgi:hypothetical protein